MIQVKPYVPVEPHCNCGGEYRFVELLWQGLHICERSVCSGCNKTRILSLPANQSILEQYIFYPQQKLICNNRGEQVKINWHSSKLVAIASPDDSPIGMDIEIFENRPEVLILNTLDYIYGHSLLFLLNLQRILKSKNGPGIVVIVQPIMRWLVPKEGIAEIWTVNLGFREFNKYYSKLTERINAELRRYDRVWLSRGHPIPTTENILIEKFSGIRPFDFSSTVSSRITYIWREDPDRLWIRNILILKGFKKLGISKLLFPVHLYRVARFFRIMRKNLGNEYRYTVAGLGRSGHLPAFVDDQRINAFDQDKERTLCRIYSESLLVIGVHGSAMILPSAHAGMAISLMPSRRWGNFAEDIIYTENDVRLSAFQRRIIPINLNMCDLRDLVVDMIIGRDSFIKKFIHSDEL